MEIFNSHELADVAAVCDPFEVSCNSAAEQFGAAPFADASQMVSSAAMAVDPRGKPDPVPLQHGHGNLLHWSKVLPQFSGFQVVYPQAVDHFSRC